MYTKKLNGAKWNVLGIAHFHKKYCAENCNIFSLDNVSIHRIPAEALAIFRKLIWFERILYKCRLPATTLFTFIWQLFKWVMRKYQALQGMSSTNSIDEQFFFRLVREMHWEWSAMYNVLRKKQMKIHGNSRFNYLLQITRFCNWIDTPSEYNFRLTTWKWIFQWAFGWVQCNLKSHVHCSKLKKKWSKKRQQQRRCGTKESNPITSNRIEWMGMKAKRMMASGEVL